MLSHSLLHNLPLLAKGPRRCTALVHPADAARCGVTEAAPARLIGANGRAVTVEVKISDEVMPGVISLPHGWGHDLPGVHLQVAARRPGVNLNALLDENLRDPLSGNAVLSGVPVRLEPDKRLSRREWRWRPAAPPASSGCVRTPRYPRRMRSARSGCDTAAVGRSGYRSP